MRRLGLTILGIVVVLAVAAAAFFFWPHGLTDVAEARSRMPTGADSVKRGEYLAKAADCAACHSVGSSRPYAGGLPFQLPFGTIYATNITPDRDTGIGQWSDAEFVRAMHHGVGRDGRDLYPAFPYASYALMSTEDALAIKDYLFSLSPVHAEAPPHQLKFPYDQSYLLRAWKLLFVPRQQFNPDPGQSTAQNRGAYLVEALGHCGECHTPRNRLYGLDSGQKFAGAVTTGWKAYNITSDATAGIGAWSDQALADYLSKGFAQGHGAASGSMAEAVEYSLSHLTPEDIKAMVAYLRTVPAHPAPHELAVAAAPRSLTDSTHLTPAAADNDQESLGLEVFQGACASCHGFDGTGVNDPRAALAGSQTVNDPSGVNLLQVLLQGSRFRTDHVEAAMPSFHAYRDVELAAVANYVLAHFGAKSAQISPDQVAQARRGQ
ncbi:c-type cytochrome [Bradyrhizobium sp. USDA 4353]